MEVASNAERQSYLLQRIQNEEAARLKKQLLVRPNSWLCVCVYRYTMSSLSLSLHRYTMFSHSLSLTVFLSLTRRVGEASASHLTVRPSCAWRTTR